MGLTSLMALYPPSTRFFLNVWTWGYEDIYKEVARKFDTKVRRLFGLRLRLLFTHDLQRSTSTDISTPCMLTSRATRSSVPSSPKMNQRPGSTHASGSSDVNMFG